MKRRRRGVEGFVSGSSTVASHSYPIEFDVHVLRLVVKRQSGEIDVEFYSVFALSPVNITSGDSLLP